MNIKIEKLKNIIKKFITSRKVYEPWGRTYLGKMPLWLIPINIYKKFESLLTISSLSGTRERKSNSSLLGMVLGLSNRLENFIRPQKRSSQRSGTKCRTRMAPNSRTTANQVSSGTEKLNVLGVTGNSYKMCFI